MKKLVISTAFYEQISRLSLTDRGILFTDLLLYAREGTTLEELIADRVELLEFVRVLHSLIDDQRKHQEEVRAAKIIAGKASAAKRWGSPNNNNKTQE